ncbi:hypothetical protein [Radicibacter daui]|uniref:hypothetical protein n=1 Tax=Radicibacter daui TaxID=3064829 RepID=UPI004046FA95
MKFNIRPSVGFDQIDFGTPVAEVRARMGTTFESFKRTPEQAFPADYFPEDGAFLYYDAQGQLEAVELASPAQARIGEHDLLALTFKESLACLKRLDPDTVADNSGANAPALGIGLWSPLCRGDEAAPVEAVIIFRKGYYGR